MNFSKRKLEEYSYDFQLEELKRRRECWTAESEQVINSPVLQPPLSAQQNWNSSSQNQWSARSSASSSSVQLSSSPSSRLFCVSANSAFSPHSQQLHNSQQKHGLLPHHQSSIFRSSNVHEEGMTDVEASPYVPSYSQTNSFASTVAISHCDIMDAEDMDVMDGMVDAAEDPAIASWSQPMKNGRFSAPLPQTSSHLISQRSMLSSAPQALTQSPCMYCLRASLPTSSYAPISGKAHCSHCDRLCCTDTCLQTCAHCHSVFCGVCSTTDYSTAFERALCLECLQL